jgi:hypothetical protein
VNFPATRNFASDQALYSWMKRLWVAATANYEAMSDPDSSVNIGVPTNAAAAELAAMVIDFDLAGIRAGIMRLAEYPPGDS